MTKTLLFLGIAIFSILGFSQKKEATLELKFDFKFNDEKFILNKKYISSHNDTLEIKILKFYISKICIDFDDNSNLIDTDFHLIDFENNTPLIPIIVTSDIKTKTVKKIKFSVGIDSLTNVSGAFGGDLDVTKGMYWAWQSGYINFKLEGKSNSCLTPKNKFQFHIGGYLSPFLAIREISLLPKNNDLIIAIDVSKLFSEIKLSETNSIMIPGKKAVDVANILTKMFY
jgi:hypothetical protein